MIRYLFHVCTVVYRWLAWPIIGAIVLVAIAALFNPEYSGTERVLGFLSGSASVVGGIVLGVLWYETVIFQALYDVPRAIYWRSKGWATGGLGAFSSERVLVRAISHRSLLLGGLGIPHLRPPSRVRHGASRWDWRCHSQANGLILRSGTTAILLS